MSTRVRDYACGIELRSVYSCENKLKPSFSSITELVWCLYVRREEATFTNSLLYYIGSISQCSIKIILYALLSTLMVYIEQEIYTIIEL